jgi:hypothetical protein
MTHFAPLVNLLIHFMGRRLQWRATKRQAGAQRGFNLDRVATQAEIAQRTDAGRSIAAAPFRARATSGDGSPNGAVIRLQGITACLSRHRWIFRPNRRRSLDRCRAHWR